MTLEPGHVVLVPFPFSNLRSAKQRPALVLSRADYNSSSPDVIVCALTSNLAASGHSVLVSQRDMAQGTLAADSRVKVDKLATLEQSIVRKTVGKLRPAALQQVLRELATLLPKDALR